MFQLCQQVLVVVVTFHSFNMVVKRNVISNRRMSISLRQCCVKILENWKRSLRRRKPLCRRTTTAPGDATGTSEDQGTTATATATDSNQEVARTISTSVSNETRDDPAAATSNDDHQNNGRDNSGNTMSGEMVDVPLNDTASETASALTKIHDSNGSAVNNNAVAGTSSCDVGDLGSDGVSTSPSAIKFIDMSDDFQSNTGKDVSVCYTRGEVCDGLQEVVVDASVNKQDDAAENVSSHMAEKDEGNSGNDNGGYLSANNADDCKVSEENNNNGHDKGDFVVINITTDVSVVPSTSTAVEDVTAGDSAQSSSQATAGDSIITPASASTTTTAAPATVTASDSTAPTTTALSVLPITIPTISEEDQQTLESVQCVKERSEILLFTLIVCPLIVFFFYGIIWHDEAIYWR